ncbi:MAG: LmbE family protein, partial [Flavobacteriales bacterium]|nr:LmbE family protein [Flavobacteriales bacterium]
TRFPTPDSNYGGHGHHSSSALLAQEAFKLAADPKAYPEQLNAVSVWQPKRLLFNASSWWNPEIEKLAVDNPDYITLDVGAYNPVLGMSYNEIAALSRSMHKSQGFGASRARGTQLDYLQHTAGERASGKLFDGVDTHWSRIKGGEAIGHSIAKLIATYDPYHPEKLVLPLVNVYKQIDALDDNHWKVVKLKEVKQLILNCAGVHAHAWTEEYAVPGGEHVKIELSVIRRGKEAVKLKNMRVAGHDTVVNTSLAFNKAFEKDVIATVPERQRDQPYWLQREDVEGVFHIPFQHQVGLPENPPTLTAQFVLEVGGVSLDYTVPVMCHWTDRVDAERLRPLILAPQVTANFAQPSVITAKGKLVDVTLTMKSWSRVTQSGEIKLQLPKGWSSSPLSRTVDLQKAGDEQLLHFTLTAPDKTSIGKMTAVITSDGKEQTLFSEKEITYTHIRPQLIFPSASVPLTAVDLQSKPMAVGYIMGPGDDVPAALTQLGFTVEMLDEESLSSTDLSRFDAIITGIRAYNTQAWLPGKKALLMDYVHAGGLLLVQYNTSGGISEEMLGPYPFHLSRDRVTKETASASVLEPRHSVLDRPHKIEVTDFLGWVQERGLYFADQWDEHYTPVIGWHDPDEAEKKGGLLIADYGDGAFIYTGISFFRQLPAGVPGAIRLFVNLISYERSQP